MTSLVTCWRVDTQSVAGTAERRGFSSASRQEEEEEFKAREKQMKDAMERDGRLLLDEEKRRRDVRAIDAHTPVLRSRLFASECSIFVCLCGLFPSSLFFFACMCMCMF